MADKQRAQVASMEPCACPRGRRSARRSRAAHRHKLATVRVCTMLHTTRPHVTESMKEDVKRLALAIATPSWEAWLARPNRPMVPTAAVATPSHTNAFPLASVSSGSQSAVILVACAPSTVTPLHAHAHVLSHTARSQFLVSPPSQTGHQHTARAWIKVGTDSPCNHQA